MSHDWFAVKFRWQEWLEWLDSNSIAFGLCIREKTIVGNRLAKEYKRKPEEKKEVFGMELFFGGKVEKGKRIYVVSNRYSGKETLALYQHRWRDWAAM